MSTSTRMPFPFGKRYLWSIVISSVVFGLSHGAQAVIRGAVDNRSYRINPSSFYVVIPFELIQSIVFFVCSLIIMYLPAKAVMKWMLRMNNRSAASYAFIGSVIGGAAIPLCAYAAFSILPLEGAPTYWERCVEFCIPMVISGLAGGYAMWWQVRRSGLFDSGLSHIFE